MHRGAGDTHVCMVWAGGQRELQRIQSWHVGKGLHCVRCAMRQVDGVEERELQGF